jgi:hypothetical protein
MNPLAHEAVGAQGALEPFEPGAVEPAGSHDRRHCQIPIALPSRPV